MVLQTYTNEVIEFYKSLPALLQLGVPVISVGAFATYILQQFYFYFVMRLLSIQGLVVIGAIAAFFDCLFVEHSKGRIYSYRFGRAVFRCKKLHSAKSCL